MSLVPLAARSVVKNGWSASRTRLFSMWRESRRGALVKTDDDDLSGDRLLVHDEDSLEALDLPPKDERLSLGQTARLSLEFSMLWFLANYFASACLEYTSVGSVTILTSTSSIWTLVFGALTGVEVFTYRKLVGVLASLVGVVLISSVDLSGSSDSSRGSFPFKTTFEMAIGDGMALVSSLVYGVYVTVMKRRVGDEDKVDMPLFFGLIGLFNIVVLWPMFFVLHYTGIEKFEFPPSGKIWTIIMVRRLPGLMARIRADRDAQFNSIASFLSDMSWAYAMLLTTPLIVTVGLSLTIPLSLIGEIIQYGQHSSWIYWVGAVVVLMSFLFINAESPEDEKAVPLEVGLHA